MCEDYTLPDGWFRAKLSTITLLATGKTSRSLLPVNFVSNPSGNFAHASAHGHKIGRVSHSVTFDRAAVVQRGRRLEYFTLAWNCLEGLVALVAGALAGSISLVGFGIDSFIEVVSGGALLWRMKVDHAAHRRERNERLALRIVGFCFLALAVYIAFESVRDLLQRSAPQRSVAGIAIACASLVAMPLLARAKRRVGRQLNSAAMHADARQTEFCTYLSAILLAGLLLNALLGWWWADPLAGLVMAPIIAREGVEGLRGRACQDCAA